MKLILQRLFFFLFLNKINPTFIAIIPGDIYSNLFYQPIDRSAIDNNSIQLFQNQPNPFSNSTSIPFVLPSQQEVRFDFYDVNGSLIKSMNQDYSAGYHQLTIDANELTTTGMIYYQMITKDNIQTKSMLLIKK
ncbi:MAG: hypothetical protein IPL95_19760 [Saprospiraceae bacterium]|nr:hypothetical protein [Saprospiraceae bacterium]